MERELIDPSDIFQSGSDIFLGVTCPTLAQTFTSLSHISDKVTKVVQTNNIHLLNLYKNVMCESTKCHLRNRDKPL